MNLFLRLVVLGASVGVPILHSGLAYAQSCQTSCPYNDYCPYSESDYENGSSPISADPCLYPSTGCPPEYDSSGTCCYRDWYYSPILIDLGGKGFRLTDVQHGVYFREKRRDYQKYKTSWTEASAQNAWLVLDRNKNGVVDDAGELFGNKTAQPKPQAGARRNGFSALAVFDSVEEGGNEDGWISKDDRIFVKLRVWLDLNHDGISQPEELLTLPQAGIKQISVQYEKVKKYDQYGNSFKYVAEVKGTQGSTVGAKAYDIYLMAGAPENPAASASSGAFPPSDTDTGFTPTTTDH